MRTNLDQIPVSLLRIADCFAILLKRPQTPQRCKIAAAAMKRTPIDDGANAAMRFEDYKFLVYADLYRLIGKSDLRTLLRFIFRGESFKYIFWMRTCHYAAANRWLRFSLLPIARFFLHHLKYKLGISIPYTTQIGPGFYIGHFGGIVVNSHSIIGKNCNMSHGVTLGQANRGEKKGYPQIGDNVYIGPGAKIVGNVRIGNNVAIGANCVVTKDVPDNAVVVGIPGKAISYKGSAGYVLYTDYEDAAERVAASETGK